MSGMSAYVTSTQPEMREVPVYTTETVSLMKPQSSIVQYLPLYVFIILVVVTLLINLFSPGSAKTKILNMLISIVWNVLWGLLIYFLCRSGKTTWAWVVLFLPLIIWTILAVMIFTSVIVVS